MRIEICDFELHPATPEVASLLQENTNLKSKNTGLLFFVGTVVVMALIFTVKYLKLKEENEKEKYQKHKRSKDCIF